MIISYSSLGDFKYGGNMNRYAMIQAEVWMKTFVITCLTLSAINVLGMDAKLPDSNVGEVSHVVSQQAPKPSSGWLGWKSYNLTDNQAAEHEANNSLVQAVSNTGAYLGIKPQGMFLSRDRVVASEPVQAGSTGEQQPNEGLYFDNPNRQRQQQNLNYAGQAISYTGDALGFKSQGWLLPKDQKIEAPAEQQNQARAMSDQITADVYGPITAEEAASKIDLSQIDFNPNDRAHYNAYYGVKFGPTFFRMYESTPNFLKSWDGFTQSASDFFSVFTVRASHLANTEGESWTQAAGNLWTRFIQVCTRRFDNEGNMVERQTKPAANVNNDGGGVPLINQVNEAEVHDHSAFFQLNSVNGSTPRPSSNTSQ